MAHGRGGRRGQVPNEEAPHRNRNVQDVMIEDLQRQVAELTQRLAAQEVGNREMENSDSNSTFNNPYHNPAPYREQRVRDEEFVDEEFQEDEFVDEEFIHGDVHEDVEDPSQGFVDWDSPPIYDIDIMDEDLMGDSLSYDQEKKSVVDLDWVSPIICDDIYPDEDDLLNEVSSLVDEIKFIEENNDYHVFDESPHNEGFQWSNEEISYVDFIGIERFLSNSPSNKLDVGFGVLPDNFNFCGQERIDNFLKTFMESELEKINERCEKIDLFQFSVRLVVVMGCNLFIFWFQVTLVLRNTRCNELIGHPKNRSKDDSNLRTNSFKLGETDAGENQTQDLKI
jgi:hypothetical protein